MQQSITGDKKYIKLYTITTKKREYSTEYQKQILTTYEEGKTFDEINKCRLNQQGICQATIYMFLNTYKIPKRVKRAGEIWLPVQLNYIENEKSKSISKQDFDEQDDQNITCPQEKINTLKYQCLNVVFINYDKNLTMIIRYNKIQVMLKLSCNNLYNK
ncbi:Hypothetical_protein [Hexamita inflata]|uniref:Hypothetical_protein n=1 Tax=Hexamita inflata TaxID=28002 RepID=A0AA86UCK6_9EUKA|nr:Hypothetical protein HINF_LOCUS24453 [Hexamita inflata]